MSNVLDISTVSTIWKDAYEKSGKEHASDIRQMLELLEKILNKFPAAYIAIDAVDECSEPAQVVKYLRWLHENTGRKVRVMLSSRPQTDLVKSLPGVAVIKISRELTGKDLELYVREAVTNAFETGLIISKDTRLREEICSSLIKNAGGMYVARISQPNTLGSFGFPFSWKFSVN